MRSLSVCVLMLGLVACVATPAGAAPITVGGGWQDFTWDNGPGVWNAEGAFTFSAAFSTELKVVDGGVVGDRFEVYDLGTLIGTTSVPANDGTIVGWDYDALMTNPLTSSGEFLLGPGAHSLTFKTIQIATGHPNGGAGLRVDAVVPAPAAIFLGILGTGLAGWLRRRRAL